MRQLFEAHGWLVIRVGASLVRAIDRECPLRLGPKGRPELMALRPARVVWIELEGGRLSLDQFAWQVWLKASGYEYLVIRNLEEAEAWMEEQ